MTIASAQQPLENDPCAKRLLQSTIPARLAYNWLDGSPRVVPIWFHWTGRAFVLGTPPKAPKLRALARDPRVALTIDGNEFPHPVLMVRGEARIEYMDDIVPEYAAAARRYFGQEQGDAWVQQMRSMVRGMARITIEPREVRILDFETRFPSAIAS
jgi:PPOX class probable F420-dependent enzyme